MLTEIYTYFTSKTFFYDIIPGAVGGIIILGIQTLTKQGISYQYGKKLQKIKLEYDKTMRDINHTYDEKTKVLDHHYAQQLAEFNAEITNKSNREQQDFQRKIHDFSLYSKKKHEIYPEVFQLIREIEYVFQQIDDSLSVHLLEPVNSTDEIMPFLKKLSELMHSKTISAVVADEVFLNIIKATADLELEEGKELATIAFMSALSRELFKNIRLLDNFFSFNVLYFSDESCVYIQDIILIFFDIVLSEETFSDEFSFSNKDELHEKIDELREIFRREISVGDY
ncbi:hypothetical protein ACQCPQ_31020 (plasmid) [Priestia megaterium]|uniref:hypothetical protein n=1 Tax=Priestia megaterium TaxID=1404 RepID=UPI003D06FD56